MRMCAVSDLKPGNVLGKSIYLSSNVLLLGAGFRITQEIKSKLIEKGYGYVYIIEKGTEDVIPEDVISEKIQHEAKQKLESNVTKINNSLKFKEISYSKVIETLETGNLLHLEIAYDTRKLINQIVDEISSSGITYLSSIMLKSKDTYFFDHAINTTVLALLIGVKYKFIKQELVHLGMGAFLHDIGKIVVEEQKNNTGTIDYYREHPAFGYLLLSNDKAISPLVLQTVNQHHEQQDGKGFPLGLTGNNLPPLKDSARSKGNIFRFAEICTVADAYDRMLLDNHGNKKMVPEDVIKELLVGGGSIYNKDIVKTLTKIISIYPVGSTVRIDYIVDTGLIGSYGVVAKINENDLKRPVIIITTNKYRKKIKPVIIDTSKLKHIDMKIII